MKYQIEHVTASGETEIIDLGYISISAAKARAARLSEKPGDAGDFSIPAHSVYLSAFDENGDMQEHYTYFGGALAEKDLTKDWQ